ncbi:MAG: T9SS type A sorting domain-containing protein [Bacteroidetes bacterium]|nr:T9SS type A sorting domain-containing protein [Bacteroidota bacterium]
MKKILSSIIIVLLCKFSIAQYFNYPASGVSFVTGLNYTDLGGNGTKITTNYKGQPMGVQNDNSSIQNIGFTFNFAGINFQQFVLHTNGFIKLGTDSTNLDDSYNVLFGNDANTQNVIYPFNNKLLGSNGSTEFRIYTQGTAPNRTCTIQFRSLTDSGCSQCSNPNGLSTQIQFGNIEFQIVLYETTNVIEFVYGTFLSSGNTAGYVPSNCGIKLNSQKNSTNITKASATAFSAAQFLDGPYTGNSFNTRNDNLPASGFTYRFTPVNVLTNNTQILSVRYNGKISKNYNHQISTVIRNIGKTNYTNFPITMTTTGANTYSRTITLANFNGGDIDTIYFNPPAWANAGNTFSEIKLPSDDDNTNNIDTAKQLVTNNIIGTSFDTSIVASVGSTSNQIEMATFFKNNSTNKITSLSTYISGAGRQYRFYVYGVSADTPKTKLYQGTTLTSVAGKNTLNLAPAQYINVTGDFFVVVVQISATVNLGQAYKVENYLRPKYFYFRSPQGSSIAPTSAWFDASTSTLPFTKFMIDATFQNPPTSPVDTTLLPVKFNYFTGIKEGKNNILNWQSSSEINSLGFEIQRSANGKDFVKIGFENSRGGATTIATYSFLDTKPLTGINYYRLRQLDKDGKESFSEVISINTNEKLKLEIVSLFPNPSKENASIIFNSASVNKMNITVTNLQGKVVLSQIINATKGENRVQLNTANLPAGNYLINIAEMNTENAVTTKFVKL